MVEHRGGARAWACWTLALLLSTAWLAPFCASDRPLWIAGRDLEAADDARAQLGDRFGQWAAAKSPDEAAQTWQRLQRSWDAARRACDASDDESAAVDAQLARAAGDPAQAEAVKAVLEPWTRPAGEERVRRLRGSPLLQSLDWGSRLRIVLVPLLWVLAWMQARGRRPARRVVLSALAACAALLLVVSLPQDRELARIDKQRVATGAFRAESAAWAPLPYDPAETNLAEAWRAPTWIADADPSAAWRTAKRKSGEQPLDHPFRHPLGTDALGRDAAARLLHGAAPSLEIALLAGFLALVAGLGAGTVCGLRGGWLDAVVQRAMETLASIPFLFLAIVVLSLARGHVVPGVAVATLVACFAWVPVARLVRAQTLVERAREHVLALRVVGIPEAWILVRHILPATLPAAATAAAFVAGSAVGVEAALSWLGLANSIPQATWGSLAADAGGLGHAWIWLPPSLLVASTCAALLVLGEEAAPVADDEHGFDDDDGGAA